MYNDLLFPRQTAHPVLQAAPTAENIGTTSFTLKWDKNFQGDGPVMGYVINVRRMDSADWSSVGYVDVSSSPTYTVTGLSEDTWYDVTVSLVPGGACDGSTYVRKEQDPVQLVWMSAIGKHLYSY